MFPYVFTVPQLLCKGSQAGAILEQPELFLAFLGGTGLPWVCPIYPGPSGGCLAGRPL